MSKRLKYESLMLIKNHKVLKWYQDLQKDICGKIKIKLMYIQCIL